MKPFRCLVIFILLLLPAGAAGCSPSASPLTTREQMLMGTLVSISISGAEPNLADRAEDLAFHEIRRIEQVMSTYIPESDISLINRSAGKAWRPVDPELLSVIQESLRYSRLSNGAFDITFKPLSNLWPMEPDSRPPSEEEIRKVLPLINYHDVLMDDQGRVLLKKPGMSIGLGGIAKGYAVDRAMAVLKAQGIKNAVINAGGDLLVIGRRSDQQPWEIGIQDPRNRNTLIKKMPMTNCAIATSGDYERFFIYNGVRYHHIMDPRTGYPAQGCRSVTIICPTVIMADAVATAVFVLGPEAGMALIDKIPDVQGLIVDELGEIHPSRDFDRRRVQ